MYPQLTIRHSIRVHQSKNHPPIMYTPSKISSFKDKENGGQEVEHASQDNQYLNTETAQIWRRVAIIMSLSLIVYGLVLTHFQRKQSPIKDDTEAPLKKAHLTMAEWLGVVWFVIAAAAYVVPYWVAAVQAVRS